MTKPVILVVGARPNFMKIAPLHAELVRRGEAVLLLHTGQHYDDNMSKVFFDDLGMPKPDIYLGIGSGSHATQTAKVMIEFEQICLDRTPSMVVVVGDVNSTVACSIVCAKLLVPCAHVEAGLRSFNDEMPEELNRIQTDKLSHILFTPSAAADKNILNEGFLSPYQSVVNVGDTMFDAVKMFSPFARHSELMGRLELFMKPFVLATIHRRENVNHPERLKERIDALNELHENGISVWMPLHPSTKIEVERIGLEIKFITSPPVGYLEMLWAIQHSSIVITDGGGLQKEAYFLGKHCITLRNETEWVELIDINANFLHPLGDKELLSEKVNRIIKQSLPSDKPYGKGDAAEKIARTILAN